MNFITHFFITLALFLIPEEVMANPLKELQVIRIAPQGSDVYEGEQILVEFDRPMVKLGNREQNEWPIMISPEIKGEWGWLNEKTINLKVGKEQAQKSTKYTITIKEGLKALDQSALGKEIKHEFITSLSRPLSSYFKAWKTPTSPVIRSSFNQKIRKDSLEKQLVFIEKQNKNEKILVRVIAEEWDQEKGEMVLKPNLQISENWIIEAAKDLKPNKEYQLYLNPGLLSAEGTEPSNYTDSLLEFKTFDEFKFIGFRCKPTKSSPEEAAVIFTKDRLQAADERCDPIQAIDLLFNNPVMRSQVQSKIMISPTLNTENWWGTNNEGQSELYIDRNPQPNEFYSVRLPHGLKAATNYVVSVKPTYAGGWQSLWQKIVGFFKKLPESDLQDEFGRKLGKAFNISIKLDDRKPNFVISHNNAILEKQIDSEVPLYVNNLQTASFRYKALTARDCLDQQIMNYTIPKVDNVQFAIPFKIREMLQGESGIVYGTLETNPSVNKGNNDSEARTLFAQITPYQVQVKTGYFNTMIWVTDLATGAVVKNAKVTIYVGLLEDLQKPEISSILTAGITNDQGIVFLEGQGKIDPSQELAYSWKNEAKKLLVLVEKDDNIALLPLTYNFEIDTYRVSGEKFWSSINNHYLTSWGTTAQGVYRAGDKVQYKFYLRSQNNNHFLPPPQGRYKLEITDPANKVIYELDNIPLNEFGSFSGEFIVPKSGAVGWYNFKVNFYLPSNEKENIDLKSSDNPDVVFSPMQVLISDFTAADFKVDIEADGKLFQPGKEITLNLSARLHAGGAYNDANAEITAILQAETFESKNPIAEKFFFGAPRAEQRDFMIIKKAGNLDSKGEYEVKYVLPGQPIFYGKILLEGKIIDDRGKSVAANKTLEYIGGKRLVGMRPKQWIYPVKKPAEIEIIIVNEEGNPIAGTAEIKVEKKEISVAKVKTAGNVYKNKANQEWREIGKQSLTTSNHEVSVYSFIPEIAGIYRITATTKDEKDYLHSCEMDIYVEGSDFVVWGEENDTYLPIIPEKSSYKVGETARFLLKNPYPDANALITVERFGVLDTFVQTLDSNTAIIEIPVKPDYLPNFYVSVTAFSPRVEKNKKPLEIGKLDLGKPTFRMGYAKINVTDHYKEIIVTVKSDKDVYRPREKVKVDLSAAFKHPSDTMEPIELAVAVIDDGVFDLVMGGRKYYDPYQGFYQQEQSSLGVRNFSLLNGLVGRIKFETKGANPGGGGGVDLNLRNIFKFVSYWNPSVIVNANGKATIEFEAPDNLTGWRVFVIAMSPTDKMGLGEGSFAVNKSTELRPVMPNHITLGDNFSAGFSIMNRTDKKREIKVSILATETAGEIAVDPAKASEAVEETESFQYQQTVTLEPFKRANVFMPIRTGKNPNMKSIDFKVTAGDAIDEDQLSYVIPVKSGKTLETVAKFAMLSDENEAIALKIPLHIPSGIIPNTGEIKVFLSSSMINNIAGVFNYMKYYPYSCWEQKLSRAIVAGYYKDLQQYIGQQVEWKNSDNFVETILEEANTFQAANGGVGYYGSREDYVDPFLSAFTSLGFCWLAENGYKIPKLVEERLLDYLDNLLKQDFVESHYTENTVATTRAVILETFAHHGRLTLADLERFLPHLQKMNAYGKASFARAAIKISGTEDIANKAISGLIAHFNETATQMSWIGSDFGSSSRILDTPLRDSCSALETLVAYSQTPNGKQLVSDKVVKLANTVTESRKSKLAWGNTQENLHCVRALAAYSKIFENQQPQATVRVSKLGEEIGQKIFTDLNSQDTEFKIPFQPQEIGTDIDLSITKQGLGRIYATTRFQYALEKPILEAVNAGFEVKREYSVLQDSKWVLLNKDLPVKRGDLVRIDLYVIVRADKNFVVVNDPVPGCLEAVNKNLANASLLDQGKLDNQPASGAWWYSLQNWIDFDVTHFGFYYKEMRHDSVRFYADYLSRGNYYLSYVAQVIADGEFIVDPTHAEEMYAPENYGRSAPFMLKTLR